MKAFISYAHTDEKVLERLHKHLANLTRQGAISTWYDREILAGADINAEISEELKSCELFIALVSPDFIASEYCYEREMTTALERHEAGEVIVVPVIIEPCDWKETPLQKLKALPRNGKPVSEWTNQNTAFLDVTNELRRLLLESSQGGWQVANRAEAMPPQTDCRYRVRRKFDEIDLGDFRDQAFEEIQVYFRAAIAEFDQVEGLRGRFFSRDDGSFGCTLVNQGLDNTAHITVFKKAGDAAFGDIYYSFSENASPNTANGGFSIASDDFDLFLSGQMHWVSGGKDRFSARETAEFMWSQLLEQIGVEAD